MRQQAIANAKARAKKQGLPFTLAADRVDLPPATCPCCGEAMKVSSRKGGKPTSPTLDRLIPEHGYVPGNVVWLCRACNMLKGETTPATLDNVYRVADWLYEEYRDRKIPCATRLRPLT
jgi:hypothetical protein